ncbi:response regulator [Sulfitobacter sp. S190]|uniref:response regulator n=1 Tax=Sulfitobacter sp. S190 TaxID=2867022 RepID=UPI0021A9728E|nr:response regulator [Sulfitobacter sp. S190]UWR23263.1 response regulator [Sulfitobacter sp. S190]
MSSMNRITATLDQQALHTPDFASILIVDDQRFDRMRLQRMCANFGFTTHTVEADSLDAMRNVLKKDKFDLILLDYYLPDGTGLDGVDSIRADATNSAAATIMITGSDDAEVGINALKLGFSDYLTKDELSVDALRRAAITALQKSRLTTGLQTQGRKRKEMQTILQRFSKECAQEIKPTVSRMMRQMRELREIQSLTQEQAIDRIDRVETSCRRLWDFLNELEHYRGDDLTRKSESDRSVASMLDLTQAPTQVDAVLNTSAAPPAAARSITPRKPPSIFGKRKG